MEDEGLLQLVVERYGDFTIDLLVEEAMGGHAIKFHVGKTKGMRMTSIEMSPGFRAFTGYMIQEHDLFDTMDEWIGFGFANMAWSEAHLLPGLARFLDEILEPGAMTDAELEALWTASNADFFVLEPDIRRFLTRMRELLDERLAS